MSGYRMTIRNVDPELADLLRELAEGAGMTLGDTFDEAVIALENYWSAAEHECELENQLRDQIAASSVDFT